MYLQSGRSERSERLYVHSDGLSVQLAAPVPLEVRADVHFESNHGQIEGVAHWHAGF